jgi:hypothetical protein
MLLRQKNKTYYQKIIDLEMLKGKSPSREQEDHEKFDNEESNAEPLKAHPVELKDMSKSQKFQLKKILS